ncbi:MAG: putative ABC transporter permease [Candidatus Saccharibacteria bacterium]|nr:putative ABC transporter permease [Candidatus Saccharibacteria bacterium]
MKVKPASDNPEHELIKPRQRLIRPIETDYDDNWRTWKFWRNAFLIYWIFSLVGHILEIIWVNLPLLVGLPPTNVLPLLVVAAPYGFGALALIWVIYPLVKKNRANAGTIFVLSCILGGVVEFICAAAIVAITPNHVNVFWDYSDQPFNLFGWVCLKNCIAFGIASVPGVYWGFPLVNNFINWLDKKQTKLLTVSSAVLFVVYMAIQVMVVTNNAPSKVFNLPRPYFDIAGVCKGQPTCPPPGYPQSVLDESKK